MVALLGYWNIRCLAQPIRLLLEYTGTDYEEKRYQRGLAPDFSSSCWLKEKFTMGYDFPNLPHFEDGDGTKVTQSIAIMRYIARKNDLCGKSDKDKLQVDIIEAQSSDFRWDFINLCYDSNYENLKEEFWVKAKLYIEQFSQYLGDKNWFVGEELTYVDILMYEGLDVHRIMDPKCLDGSTNLVKFIDRFEDIPRIKKYMKSDRFLTAPLNDTQATYGYK